MKDSNELALAKIYEIVRTEANIVPLRGEEEKELSQLLPFMVARLARFLAETQSEMIFMEEKHQDLLAEMNEVESRALDTSDVPSIRNALDMISDEISKDPSLRGQIWRELVRIRFA